MIGYSPSEQNFTIVLRISVEFFFVTALAKNGIRAMFFNPFFTLSNLKENTNNRMQSTSDRDHIELEIIFVTSHPIRIIWVTVSVTRRMLEPVPASFSRLKLIIKMTNSPIARLKMSGERLSSAKARETRKRKEKRIWVMILKICIGRE